MGMIVAPGKITHTHAEPDRVSAGLLPAKCEILVSDSFDAPLTGKWDRLLSASDTNTVFLTSGWLRAWHETLGCGRKLIIPQICNDGKLIAAAAFQNTNGVIEFAGKGPSDYADFVISSEAPMPDAQRMVDALLDAVIATTPGFRHFLLGRIPPESRSLVCLQTHGGRFHATISKMVTAPTMDMSVVAEKLRKKSLKRHEKALERHGIVACHTYTRAHEILPQLEPFFDQHVNRWRPTEHPSLFLRPENRAFYRSVVKHLDESGALRFTTLTLDGRLVAAHFGFLHAARYIWYKPSFDPHFAELSPGEVLIKRLLEQACNEGAAEFDFTIGSEPFKFRFATRVRDVAYVHVTPSRLKAFLKRTRVFVKRTVMTLRQCQQQWLSRGKR